MTHEADLDQVDAALALARSGRDPRPLLAAMSPALRAQVEEVLAAERALLDAQGAAAAPAAPTARGADPFVGATLSGCVLERLLGRGGMGAAYAARRQVDGAPVVVKLLAPGAASDPHLRARLRREAEALRRVGRHPNVVSVLAADVDADAPHLVLELVAGAQLRATIQAAGRLAPTSAARVARDVARGLAVLHGHGILHRDVKPENVVVTPEGRARLIDFGIAKDLFLSGLTAPGQLVGTAEYMSPEQWSGGPQDARTDLFALGATLFHMLTGRPPFTGGELDELMDQALAGEFPPPRELAPDVPVDLERVVLHLLAPSPRFRYGRAERVAHDLDRVLRGEPPEGLPSLVDLESGARHPLLPGERFVVGSGSGAQVRLAHPSVAATHAEVRRDEAGFSLVDLRSPTGTWVGEERLVRPRALEDDDVVRVGDVRLRVSDPEGRRRPPAWLDDLERVEHPDPVVSALVRGGDPRAIAALLELLAPDPLVERAATEVVTACAGDAAPAILARRARLVADARAAAPGLLQAASGEALGADPVAWLSWWLQVRGRHARQVGPARPPRALRLVPSRGAPAVLVALAGEPGVLLVGRDDRCHLRLDDPTVSRLHATVLRLHRRLVVRDEGSASATTLDGAAVHVALLDPGATLRLGDTTVTVEGQDLVTPDAHGARPVDPATFQALDEAGHPSTLSGHAAALEAAARFDVGALASALSPGVARAASDAWRARASRARQALAAHLGRDLGDDPQSWRAALRARALPGQVTLAGLG